jgi:hypothetical protein
VRDFTDQDWEDFIDIIRQTKTYDSGYKVVLEERQPGTADLLMSNVSLFDLMIWMHHFAAKDAFDTMSPDFLDFAHVGPAFFTWHRWYHVFFENEVQAMLQAMGRDDYHKFRFPYWDWRGEIQRSYGLPSEELFAFDRLGETRNISNRPVVFGDILGQDWTTMCLDTFYTICDPNNRNGSLQRCPFTGDPNLCHSSNPDWPTMQEVNELMKFEEYETPPFNSMATNSLRPIGDFIPVASIQECREDLYCLCIPGGAQCLDESPQIIITTGVHAKVHYLPGLGGAEVIPPEFQGAFYDVAASPNDPLFILHHLMMDCILQEWLKRHPGSDYPVHPDIREGHRKDDYISTYFPLITNGEVFPDAQEFGYYCTLPNIGLTEPVAPSELEPIFSFIISDSSVDVCVETESAMSLKLILRDTNSKRYVETMTGSSGCSTFPKLPAGVHNVRAISRGRNSAERFKSEFYYFSTK